MAGDPDGPKNTMKLGYIHKIIYESGNEKVYSPMYKDANRDYIKRREPGLSALFSVLLPGAGQFYNKDKGKAYIMAPAYVAGITFFAIGQSGAYSYGKEVISYIGFGMILGTWLWAVIDAHIRAGIINQRYNLVNGTIFDNDNFGIQFKPYLATHTLSPGFDLNTAFAVCGARMTLTLNKHLLIFL